MAINRDGYKSLVESVNEAVMAGKAPTTTDNTASGKGKGGKQTPTAVSRKGKSARTTSSGNATDNPGWQGGPYGSSDAYDLANILNQMAQMAQGGSSKKSGNAVGVSKSPAAATLSSKNKSSTGKPIAETQNTWGSSSYGGAMGGEQLARWLNSQYSGAALSTPKKSSGTTNLRRRTSNTSNVGNTAYNSGSASGMGSSSSGGIAEGWGSAAYGGAMNAMELAQWLNSLLMGGSSSSTPRKSSGSTNLRGRGRASTSNIGKTAYDAGSDSKGVPAASTVTEDQDWDILDEILAEGLELYGEDGLAEILTSFAVSGEMSQELADLLSDE